MICEECRIEPIEPIHAKTEMLTCHRCGGLYPSRGKNDCGYCRQCEPMLKALSGGPLNGVRLYHEDDKKYTGLIEEE